MMRLALGATAALAAVAGFRGTNSPAADRFAKLGVIASVQPGHAVEDMPWAEQRVGPERIKGAYAWRSLRTSGAQMLLSSDMPGSSYDFFYMIHAAITRRDKDNKPRAVGRRADVTILDRDPFVVGAAEPDKLIGSRAVATIVGGRVVYEAKR